MYVAVIDFYHPDDARQYSRAYGPFDKYNDASEFARQFEDQEDYCSSEILTVNSPQPEIVVHMDYDGFFERLIRGWISQKVGLFKHKKITISAGPYRSAAVSYSSKDGTLNFDFYSALRNGFGSLSADEMKQIIDLL